jgi:short-subunit dehydrogenase
MAKVVLVTGASSGIGAAVAQRYGAAGVHVLLLARNADRLANVAREIRGAGGTATTYPIALEDAEATKETAARIEAEIGPPDVLINNAGTGRWGPFLETSPQEARAAMDVPYLAAFNMTRAFAPAMVSRGSGTLVFVSSPAAYLAWPNASAYIASRRAVAALADVLRSELKPTGVHVSLVVLGEVEGTGYWEHNPGSRQYVPERPPFVKPISTEDAANAIFDGAERQAIVVKPRIYRALFLMNALFPKTVASQLRRASKKALKPEDS